MKRNTNTETNDTQAPTLFEINEIAGNVLNFSSTLSELRWRVELARKCDGGLRRG